MKLKDIIQITVFTVIAFVLGMAVSMGTGMLGTVSLYEYSGAAEPLFRKSGNRLSGIGNRHVA